MTRQEQNERDREAVVRETDRVLDEQVSHIAAWIHAGEQTNDDPVTIDDEKRACWVRLLKTFGARLRKRLPVRDSFQTELQSLIGYCLVVAIDDWKSPQSADVFVGEYREGVRVEWARFGADSDSHTFPRLALAEAPRIEGPGITSGSIERVESSEDCCQIFLKNRGLENGGVYTVTSGTWKDRFQLYRYKVIETVDEGHSEVEVRITPPDGVKQWSFYVDSGTATISASTRPTSEERQLAFRIKSSNCPEHRKIVVRGGSTDADKAYQGGFVVERMSTAAARRRWFGRQIDRDVVATLKAESVSLSSPQRHNQKRDETDGLLVAAPHEKGEAQPPDISRLKRKQWERSTDPFDPTDADWRWNLFEVSVLYRRNPLPSYARLIGDNIRNGGAYTLEELDRFREAIRLRREDFLPRINVQKTSLLGKLQFGAPPVEELDTFLLFLRILCEITDDDIRHKFPTLYDGKDLKELLNDTLRFLPLVRVAEGGAPGHLGGRLWGQLGSIASGWAELLGVSEEYARKLNYWADQARRDRFKKRAQHEGAGGYGI